MCSSSEGVRQDAAIPSPPMAEGDEVINSAKTMIAGWPSEYVRRREIPVFTGFRLSQEDIERLEALGAGPKVFDIFDNEPVYMAGALAIWFITKGHLGAGGQGSYQPWNIPSVWFSDRSAKPGELNSFEIFLHRKAEAGEKEAQTILELAVKWPGDFVGLTDIEEFTECSVSNEEFFSWVEELLCGVVPEDLVFEKWEMAQYFYWLFKNRPQMVLNCPTADGKLAYPGCSQLTCRECIESGMQKLSLLSGITVEEMRDTGEIPIPPGTVLDMEGLAAMISLSRDLEKAEVFAPRGLFDVFDLNVWLDLAVKSLPNPISQGARFSDEAPHPENKMN